jgi:NADPH:quinone reductase-like Zn-dependent oxidoreductase
VLAVQVDPATRSLVVTDVADPTPGPGQLLVRVRAAGLNRADLAVRAGTYVVGTGRTAPPARPFTAGGELAGEVMAVGDAAEGDWRVGDRVMAQGAGYAELAVVDARLALPAPPVLSWEEAGALPVALLTMHDALVTNGRWAPGEHVVVHAVSSGVGVIGAQLALHLGAPTVVGTSRTAAKRDRLAALLGEPDRFAACDPTELVATVARMTDGHGADVVVDNVGAAVLADTLEAMAILGRIVQVGRLGGRTGTLDLDELARKRVSLIGVTFRTRTTEERPAVVAAAWRDLADAVTAGVLRPPVHAVFPLADAVAAQEALARDEHVGKLVLVP